MIAGLISGIVSQVFPTGSFYSETGFLITIEDSIAVIRFPENHLPTRYSDTVAVCRITPESESFIRIDSESPYKTVLDCIHIEEIVDETESSDSLYVSFQLPVIYTQVQITIQGHNFSSKYVLEYPSKRTIALPKQDNYSFGVDPVNASDILSGFNIYSVPALWPVFPIQRLTERFNSLLVVISCIDDCFFERAWIQGEYVKLTKDGLVWRGMTFCQLRPKGL